MHTLDQHAQLPLPLLTCVCCAVALVWASSTHMQLFVEYVTNDGYHHGSVDNSLTRAFERLLRKLLTFRHAPAVVLMEFFATDIKISKLPFYATGVAGSASGTRGKEAELQSPAQHCSVCMTTLHKPALLQPLQLQEAAGTAVACAVKAIALRCISCLLLISANLCSFACMRHYIPSGPAGEDQYGVLAQYYSIPWLSYRDAVWHDYMAENPGFRRYEIFPVEEERHPTPLGHRYLLHGRVHWSAHDTCVVGHDELHQQTQPVRR